MIRLQYDTDRFALKVIRFFSELRAPLLRLGRLSLERFTETVRRRMDDPSPGGNAGSRLRNQSGRYLRAFTPGASENTTVIDYSGDRLRMELTPDTDAVPYIHIHEVGGKIEPVNGQKMLGMLWYLYLSTGEERYKWMALKVKHVGYLEMPARPTAGAALERWKVGERSLMENDLRQAARLTWNALES